MKNKFALIYILISTFFFSSMEVAIKLSSGAFNPLQLNLIRFFIGGLILVPISVRHMKKISYVWQKSDIIRLIVAGFMNVVLSMSFYTSSVSYIPAYTAAIIFSGNTFFSIIFARLILKEKIEKSSLIALAISLFGIVYIINPFNFEGSISGFVLCLISAILFALYGVTSKYFAKTSSLNSVVITSFGFLLGSFELFLIVLLSHIPFVSNMFLSIGLDKFSMIPVFSAITADNILILAFICIGVTGIGFASYFLAMENLPVSMVSLVFFIKPVLAPIIAYFLLGEIISTHNLIGLLFIVIGSIILFVSNIEKK